MADSQIARRGVARRGSVRCCGRVGAGDHLIIGSSRIR
jgi:hypothetical protein